jgi:hypothetical protein
VCSCAAAAGFPGKAFEGLDGKFLEDLCAELGADLFSGGLGGALSGSGGGFVFLVVILFGVILFVFVLVVGAFFFFLAGFLFFACGLGAFFFFVFVGFFVGFFVFFEVGVVPDGFAERSFADGGGVEDDVVAVGFEAGSGQIDAGGLQGVEKESGGLGVELAGDDEAHDLHEGNLDGVGVLEDGQIDGDVAAATGVFREIVVEAIGIERDALFVMTFVEVTETVAAESGRSALRAVDLDVLTSIGKICHDFSG